VKYSIITSSQLFVLAMLIGIISSLLTISFTIWYKREMLPIVQVDQLGQCISVVNVENGHAFTCNDLGVVLRQYRTQVEKP
jgi:type IV secretory pathway TrbF-like protein